MTQQEVKFIKKISQGKTKQLLLQSLNRFIKNKEWQEIILEIKNKHALHKLQKSTFFSQIKEKIQKLYWKPFSLSLRLKPEITQHNREMKIPHAVHY